MKVISSGCGACIGCGPGVSDTPDQVTVSAINRNYRGRSGPGRLYLASPLTVAASAIAGRIVPYKKGMFRRRSRSGRGRGAPGAQRASSRSEDRLLGALGVSSRAARPACFVPQACRRSLAAAGPSRLRAAGLAALARASATSRRSAPRGSAAAPDRPLPAAAA